MEIPKLAEAVSGDCLAHLKALGVTGAVYGTKGIIHSSIKACNETDNSILTSAIYQASALASLQDTRCFKNSNQEILSWWTWWICFLSRKQPYHLTKVWTTLQAESSLQIGLNIISIIITVILKVVWGHKYKPHTLWCHLTAGSEYLCVSFLINVTCAHLR